MRQGAHILVAVSGGADSVALLHVLHQMAKRKRWQLTVAHLEHGIRGKRSREDASFVRALARRLKLPCVVGRVDVPGLAQGGGISIEMAARQARYAFLVRTARRVGAGLIATAHTADDQVETLLLKFLRGAGRGGLSGIEAARYAPGEPAGDCSTAPVARCPPLRIIRPLLDVTRAEIEAFLLARKVTWREDETNTDTAFLRNRVRHELLPQLERDYNQGIRQTLLRTQDVLVAEDEWMDDLARGILTECLAEGSALRCASLASHPLAARRRVIRLWLFGLGVQEESLNYEAVSRVERLVTCMVGNRAVDLSGGAQVQRHYGTITLAKRGTKAPQEVRARLKIPGKTSIPDWGLAVAVKLAKGMITDRGRGPGKLPARATLSAAKWAGREIWIRSWRAGDRMVPFGMTGSRKIQDILVDAKIPRAERQQVPVVECDGEIIWIPGYRIAARWAVAGGSDRNLQVTVG